MAEREDDGASRASVECAGDTDPPVIRICGEVDMSNVVSVETGIANAMVGRPERIVLDLSELRFIDSSGIAVLLRAAEKTQRVELRNPSSVVKRIIEATGLSDVLPIES
jgi:anti-sigma B factor antagonist